MKEVIKEVLDNGAGKSFRVPILEYASVDEADKAAGRVGATLDECNTNLHYRGTFADARELIVECVQEITQIPFLTVEKEVEKDGKKSKVTVRDTDKDSDAKYVKRALTTKADAFDAVQKLVEQRARGYTYKDEKGAEVKVPAIATDITVKVRVPRVLKLAQKYKDVAAEFLAGKKNIAKFNAAAVKLGLAEWAPDKTKDAVANTESLGWALKAFQDAQDAFKGM